MWRLLNPQVLFQQPIFDTFQCVFVDLYIIQMFDGFVKLYAPSSWMILCIFLPLLANHVIPRINFSPLHLYNSTVASHID